jgi:N-dimethylarginine dimethylaminohydrolase
VAKARSTSDAESAEPGGVRTTVCSHDEWSPLEEVVLGTTEGCEAIFTPDVSVAHFLGTDVETLERLASSERSVIRRAAAEVTEDLERLGETLGSAGVVVRRPPSPQPGQIELAGWRTSQFYSLAPRDSVLVVGRTVIEAPMPCRARYIETFPLRQLLSEAFTAGAVWISPPKPQLLDSTYLLEEGVARLAEDEILFDAPNVVRCGEDLFYNVSNTGNRKGAEWLRRTLGDQYRVHEVSVRCDHLDTTLVFLRPGLVLVNASRFSPETLPEVCRSWKVIWFDEPVDEGYLFSVPLASPWIGMNVLSIDPDTVVVNDRQRPLIRLLEKHGLTVVPQRFRHTRTFGTGFHCCTLDLRRGGELRRWFGDEDGP